MINHMALVHLPNLNVPKRAYMRQVEYPWHFIFIDALHNTDVSKPTIPPYSVWKVAIGTNPEQQANGSNQEIHNGWL